MTKTATDSTTDPYVSMHDIPAGKVKKGMTVWLNDDWREITGVHSDDRETAYISYITGDADGDTVSVTVTSNTFHKDDELVLAGPRKVEEGEFFYRSWGYDQTNIDFFQVVGLTPSGKSARIVSCGQKVVSSNPPDDRVVPTGGQLSGALEPDKGVVARIDYDKYEEGILRGSDYTSVCIGRGHYAHRYVAGDEGVRQTSPGWGH